MQFQGLRQQYKDERDSELDRAIEKLESEVVRGRAEVEKEFQDRIRWERLMANIINFLRP